MNYAMSFGNLRAAPVGKRGADDVFGLVVLGDFSGHANRGVLETGAALAARKPRRVDVDNLDDVLASMGLRLSLPLGDQEGAVEVAIASMDDFHPDELYENLDVFAELSGLRRRLQGSSTFAAAAAEVQSWGGPLVDGAPRARPKARGAAVPNAKLSDFARLMGVATATQEPTPADELIKQIVRPYVTPAPSPDQAHMVAAVDAALSGMMRRLLHHPDFQTLEALWRGVDLLIRELETGANLQVILYDVSAEELAADLSSADDLSQTGLYKLLVEQPGLDLRTTPPSVIVGAYMFEQTPPHADLLGRMAKIAAAARAPFIAATGVDALEVKRPDDVHPAVAESWGALRALPHAAYLGLTVPRFMLRWPYGARTEPIDPFDFEEFTANFGLKGFLWGNGAILAGLMLARTFSEQGMEGMRLGSVMNQGDLPLYYYTDQDGDQIALPCTERLASEAVATHAIRQGLMPVLWMRGRNEVRLGSLASLAGGPLAGPWGVVEIGADAPPAKATAPAPAPRPTPAPPPPPVDEDVDEDTDDDEDIEAEAAEDEADDLDALLSELEDSSNSAEEPEDQPAEEPDAADNDLDALLASIEGDAETDEGAADSGEMDPDLAALLADL